jgi:hypothetical protein
MYNAGFFRFAGNINDFKSPTKMNGMKGTFYSYFTEVLRSLMCTFFFLLTIYVIINKYKILGGSLNEKN